jgi:hypothetical protein
VSEEQGGGHMKERATPAFGPEMGRDGLAAAGGLRLEPPRKPCSNFDFLRQLGHY